MAVAAVVADHHVLRLQMRQNAHRVGFLPQAGMGGAGEDAGGELLQQEGFEAPDGIDLFVEAGVFIHDCAPLQPGTARGSIARAREQPSGRPGLIWSPVHRG